MPDIDWTEEIAKARKALKEDERPPIPSAEVQDFLYRQRILEARKHVKLRRGKRQKRKAR